MVLVNNRKLAGLIAKGYFKTIVTRASSSANTLSVQSLITATSSQYQIDGQALDRYELHHADRHFAYYLLRSAKHVHLLPGP